MCARWIAKVRPHDTNDGVRRPVEANLASDNVALGAESTAPQRVAEHHDVLASWTILVRQERPS